MTQLFKEVASPKTADKMETEELKGGTDEQAAGAFESTEKETVKKGKHGDPGVCCGGCS
ncbi:MAG: CCGSCS motif protein [Marinobacter maritimus]|jgi:CCGSCS motif protein|uniref:CCGSCS motif protein n=1 Tax=Marinobacter maritimus TaxID=277961 RepID=UPI000BD690AE|nr:CCGSCS motif protein [Marinobacter maritimus]MBL1272695.1 CCGSCS motif protein [Oceanospirillales bacterium]|tara:strand:- start:619 stop:795 length:177 start_codon:yes stop_codon:yes gene_type:complete